VLLAVVALYVVATSAGAGSGPGSSSGDPRQGLPEALGRVLVQPAGSGDLSASSPPCRRGDVLTVPAGGECAYRLNSGFLARRLRLRLTTPGDPVTAALAQPKPKVTDTETLDASHPEVELTYRQEGSTLVLTCPGKNPCVVQVR